MVKFQAFFKEYLFCPKITLLEREQNPILRILI